jgi:hypothetical protein
MYYPNIFLEGVRGTTSVRISSLLAKIQTENLLRTTYDVGYISLECTQTILLHKSDDSAKWICGCPMSFDEILITVTFDAIQLRVQED